MATMTSTRSPEFPDWPWGVDFGNLPVVPFSPRPRSPRSGVQVLGPRVWGRSEVPLPTTLNAHH